MAEQINQISDPEFDAILERLKTLHNQKRYQYANEEESMGNFLRAASMTKKLINPKIPESLHPLVMALMYVSKQIDSVYDIIGEQKTNTVEALNDKLQDVAVYFILAMILNERGTSNKG